MRVQRGIITKSGFRSKKRQIDRNVWRQGWTEKYLQEVSVQYQGNLEEHDPFV